MAEYRITGVSKEGVLHPPYYVHRDDNAQIAGPYSTWDDAWPIVEALRDAEQRTQRDATIERLTQSATARGHTLGAWEYEAPGKYQSASNKCTGAGCDYEALVLWSSTTMEHGRATHDGITAQMLTYGPWQIAYRARSVLCPDGKRRSVKITGQADTYFSMPASVIYKGRTVTGFIMGIDGSSAHDLQFIPNKAGKNGALFDEEGASSEGH